MRLLLDTCALVALAEREPMRDEAVEAIRAAQAAGEIFVPAVRLRGRSEDGPSRSLRRWRWES